MKTRRLPVLNRYEQHANGKEVPVYRLEQVEIDEKGNPIWNKGGHNAGQ